MKRILYILSLLQAIIIWPTSAQVVSDSTQIVELENLHLVDEGIYRSSQPNAEHFKALENKGVREILNIRRFNNDTDEAKDTSLKLHHIRVRAGGLKEEHLLEAMRIIQNRKGDILIHCHHGSDRTGAIIAMYRIVYQGWSKEKAIEEMKNGGYGFHSIYRNIPKLINKIDIEEFKKKL